LTEEPDHANRKIFCLHVRADLFKQDVALAGAQAHTLSRILEALHHLDKRAPVIYLDIKIN
jgi:hypothetical protein